MCHVPNWMEWVKNGELSGPLKSCEYYPCHFEGQDCTWCYCPFYPCGDSRTGGKIVLGKFSGRLVWSCEDCYWIHIPDVAKQVLERLKSLVNDGVKLERDVLINVREEVLRSTPPCSRQT